MNKTKSEIMKKRWGNPDFRKKMEPHLKALAQLNARINRGKLNPKHSNWMKRWWAQPENKQKMVRMRQERCLNPVEKKRMKVMAGWAKGKKRTPEHCKHLSEAMKKKYRQDSRYKRENLAHLKNIPLKDTQIERLIEEVLKQLGVIFRKNKTIQVKRIIARPDFFLPEYNIVIECDGDYWHSLPERKRKDRINNQLYKSLGLQVVRLKEHSILSDPVQSLLIGLEKIF